MGPHVAQAPHLGVLLLDEPRTEIPDPIEVREAIDAWSAQARASRGGAKEVDYSPVPDGAGPPFVLTLSGGLRPLRACHVRDRPTARAAMMTRLPLVYAALLFFLLLVWALVYLAAGWPLPR